MRPAGRAFQSLDVLDAQQGGENAPNPIDQIAPDASIVVIFDKAFQTSVSDSPEPHVSICPANQHIEKSFELLSSASRAGGVMKPGDDPLELEPVLDALPAGFDM